MKLIEWIKKYLLPDPKWWMDNDYGLGWEGILRQHVPAHVIQGILLFWWALGLRWSVEQTWYVFAMYATVSAAAGWELIQRERWRRDGVMVRVDKEGNVNLKRTGAMNIKHNVWDVILTAGGMLVSFLLYRVFI